MEIEEEIIKMLKLTSETKHEKTFDAMICI